MTTTGADQASISFARKLAIGSGDFGFNLYWQSASLYLLFFYTDVVGLPAATAGSIYMIALIVDAALDPVAGYMADQTRSKLGRYRPYLIIGGIPLAGSFVVQFLTPSWPDAGALMWAAAAHILFRAVYAIVSVPYSALMARVTRSSSERATLTAARMVCASVGGIIVASTTLILARMLGTEDDPRRGWLMVGAAYGVVATLFLWVAAWGARGLDVSTVEEAKGPTFAQKLKTMWVNTPMMLVLVGVVVTSFAMTFFGKNLLYYYKYVIGNEEAGSFALTFIAMISAVSIPVWGYLAGRFGKRVCWVVSSGIKLTGVVLFALFDGQGQGPLVSSLALVAIGTGGYVVAFWAMVPDTVEYAQWKTGVRAESIVFGFVTLGLKAALGFAAGLLGIALSQIGYEANVAQTPETLAALKSLMLWWPAAGIVVAGVLIIAYPISPEMHRRMVCEIDEKRSPAAISVGSIDSAV